MNRHAARGSAITEFIICLFPYMIILLGAIFFWHITLGKQELFDYSQAAAALGDSSSGQRFWNLEGSRRLRSPDQYGPGDESGYNAKVGVDPAVDEPVLPYAATGEDFKACVSRGVYLVSANPDGTINVSLSKQGRRYRDKGIIKNVVTGDHISPSTSLDFDVDEDIAAAVSRALSDWVVYGGVDGGTYRYTLQFGAGETFGLEKGAVTDNWRSRNGVTVGGRNLSAYNTRIEDPELRGNCDSVDPVTLDAPLGTDIAGVRSGASDNTGLDPASYLKYDPARDAD